MDLTQQLQEQRDKIIEDMLSQITYKPNRLNDISAMMNRYKSTEVDFKEQMAILENLGNCIAHKPYDQPYNKVRSDYTKDDIAHVANILNNFIDKVPESLDIKEDGQTLRDELNHFDTEKGGVMMDNWHMEKVHELIELAQNQEPEQSLGMKMAY